MAIYSISDLANLSGIKAHTIRMWEQRYELLQPKRTETNIRFYEDEDVQLLLNIALLNRHGIKISKIAAMSQQDIAAKVHDVSDIDIGLNAQLDVLTLSVLEMDEHKFACIFDNYVSQMGFEETMLEVVYPFMEKMSLLWLTGSMKPVQENFITQLIRNRLIVAVENEPLNPDRKAPKFLLYLPREEQQELSLLFMQYLLRKRKFQVINMGYDTGLLDVKDACRIHHPDFIFTILSENFTKEPIQRYLDRLSETLPQVQLLLTGYAVAANHLEPPKNAVFFSSLDETVEFLERVRVGN